MLIIHTMESVVSKHSLLLLSTLILSGCSRVDSLLMQPETTPTQWCDGMPCVNLPGTDIILNQPFSTFLVYLLGLMWIWAGWRFWKTRDGHTSKILWCISLGLGGVAALLAGTSYQAFGYELKCAGRELCIWSNWWEISYMTIQVASLNTMLAAVAFSCTTGNIRKGILVYAVINTIIHFCMTMTGATLPNRFMISFELLVLFTIPAFLMYFTINGWRYLKYKNTMDLVLLGCWLILVATNVFYFAYLFSGYTQTLWQQGIWFSENDVLHVFMMGWVLYVGLVVVKNVTDASNHDNQGQAL